MSRQEINHRNRVALWQLESMGVNSVPAARRITFCHSDKLSRINAC
jgi:hypothetical protein